MSVYFALAKECEDLEDWDKSFEYLSKACELKSKNTQYDVSEDIDTINLIIEKHDMAYINGTPNLIDLNCFPQKCTQCTTLMQMT